MPWVSSVQPKMRTVRWDLTVGLDLLLGMSTGSLDCWTFSEDESKTLFHLLHQMREGCHVEPHRVSYQGQG